MSKRMKTFLMVCGILVGTGIILGIIGAVLGGIKGLSQVEEQVPWISFGGSGTKEIQTMPTEAFSAINISCDAAKVQLVEGNKFAVEMEYDEQIGSPIVSVDGGVLSVLSPYDRENWFNFHFFSLGGYVDPVVRVVYPKGSPFEDVKINTDAGNVSIRKLTADYLKIDADAGDVTASGVNTNGADISMEMGTIDLEGTFEGKTKIECDMGDCNLTTRLPKNSYSVNSSVEMGTCTIDGQETGNSYINTNEGAPNYMNLNCDAGDLNIRFQ